MKFNQDRIQNFIKYKLFNSRDSEQELKLFNLKNVYQKKLTQYSTKLQKQKTVFNYYNSQYQTIVAERKTNYDSTQTEIQKIEGIIKLYKTKIDQKKKQKKTIQAQNQRKVLEYEQICMENQLSISNMDMELKNFITETQNDVQQIEKEKLKKIEKLTILQKKIQIKSKQKQQYEESIQRTQENIQKKQELVFNINKLNLQKQNNELNCQLQIQRLNSFEKVIYPRFYSRIEKNINEIRQPLHEIFSINDLKFTTLFELINQLLKKLNSDKVKIEKVLKEKKFKFKINNQITQTTTEEYNQVVSTKIDPQKLKIIDKQALQNQKLDQLESIKEGLTEMQTQTTNLVQEIIDKQTSADNVIKKLEIKIENIAKEIQSKQNFK